MSMWHPGVEDGVSGGGMHTEGFTAHGAAHGQELRGRRVVSGPESRPRAQGPCPSPLSLSDAMSRIIHLDVSKQLHHFDAAL